MVCVSLHSVSLLIDIALSAVIVGIQMISTKCEGKKFIKKIVLVTDGKGNMDSEGVTDIGEKLREDNIELVLV